MCPPPPVTISLRRTGRDPPTRDPPVLTPTLVLSLRVTLCDRQKDRWLVCRLTTMSTSSSPARPVTLAGPRSTPYLRSSCSDEGLHQHQLRSLSRSWRNHPWSSGAQRQHCPRATVLFFPNIKLVSAATTSSSIALTIPSMELCRIKCITTMPNFVMFRWRNLWQSTVYRSPVKSGREYGRV